MDEYRFLVKFPPHIRVESKVLGDANFFYLKNNTVMASLRVCNGDIGPVGRLIETWVQIKGVPPKWSDWTTIREIASSLGKITEVDWQTLFSSFFNVIRVKINCKDPRKIPLNRVVEMTNKLLLLNFTMEDLDKLRKKLDEEDGLRGEDPNGEGDGGLDGETDQPPNETHAPEGGMDPENQGDGGPEGPPSNSANQKSVDRSASVRKARMLFDEKREAGLEGAVDSIPSCISLSRQMELSDSDEESDLLNPVEVVDSEEMIDLPKEW
ncbi:hypothetical protein C2845_PM05G25390 [Panicum miliaceum]|uniref:Uncharacterized protein n=1 Tax=Panicum miliaceum TaxID=4540 RepID=A0A3L6SXY1_PANMI|nr:hypothetical protein C2845_PM05G25390 [Panicum miliaceum]